MLKKQVELHDMTSRAAWLWQRVTENTGKCKTKKRWKMMKRNNTIKQGKAYIGMYKKPVK